MLQAMAGYVKAEERRRMARAAALAVLSRGDVGPEAMSLRHVAQEMDVALSTLTYVYPSTRALFSDLVREYSEALWEAVLDHVGDGGLRAELQRAARRFYVYALGDAARVSLMMWEIKEVAAQTWDRAEADLEVSRRLVDTIAERGGEHYRVSPEVLAHMLLAFTFGQILHWVATGDDRIYWSTMLAGIDGTVLLADPRPIGTPHDQAAPADYVAVQAPDRAAEWDEDWLVGAPRRRS